ncbi:Tigger transposable element-derived protein 1 [Lucilia cuprina]|nr:Tigger transposable element-derived protein 1 [Lucilia cuprina]
MECCLNQKKTVLKKWCKDLAKCGFPLKPEDLINTVQAIIKEDQRPTPFLNGRQGRKWYMGFLKRHPSLSLREAEGISKGRAVITEEYIKKWFNELKTFLTEQNALDVLDDPSRIFNGDETSFSLCPKPEKSWPQKDTEMCTGNEKETITVLLVFSANGQTVVPMVVFPYVRPPKDVVNSLPKNWFLGKSETGWMISEAFFEYIANGVHSWLNEHKVQRLVLLFVDGHKSHMTLELSKFCEENGIILYAHPPNTTHIMQTADVSVFKPLRTEWKKTVREWQLKPANNNKVVSKSTFCPLLDMVLSKMDLANTIKNGFRKCGLYPLNPENVDYTKCVQNHSEALAIEHETNKEIKETEFDIAIDIINKIAPKLRERGIDSDIVVEEICELKK